MSVTRHKSICRGLNLLFPRDAGVPEYPALPSNRGEERRGLVGHSQGGRRALCAGIDVSCVTFTAAAAAGNSD
jgi:hypothetical protein